MSDAERDVTTGPFRLFRSRELFDRPARARRGGPTLEVLLVLVEQGTKVPSRENLLTRIRPDFTATEGTLRIHLAAAQQPPGEQRSSQHVVSTSRLGYCFVALTSQPTPTPSAAGNVWPASEADPLKLGDLRYELGEVVEDPVMSALTAALGRILERPEQVRRISVDHLMFAIGFHVAQSYCGLQAREHQPRGGLAPWQERRARALMDANLEGEISLADLAKECGISTSHFSHAFRNTTGAPPHQWLLRRRVETARRLMRNGKTSLSEVALACGFVDQSHFTRVFTKLSGTTPAAWRRFHQE